ncbi:HupE/UreJ family protein [Methyloprofundus sp.]|uniref:HupE/UreJ family protein n=1 Tax=Methyloprofundus sp. TaxID=2020875 RepID=UPI003D0D372A
MLNSGTTKYINPVRFSTSLTVIALTLLCISVAVAHGVDANTMQFLQANQGVALGPFMYIGAKHMLTGYDHLLFLLGVVFFLFRTRDILIYVSLFTLGHSLTLFFGVLDNLSVNAYLIDAIIGLSVVYKGFDNLGGFQRLFARQPNTKIAVLIFGLFHGLGLATKLQDFDLPQQDLWKNLLAFNVGVEIGQFLALLFIVILLNFWRRFNSYLSFAVLTNTLLMAAGLVLFGYQMTGYLGNAQ